MPPTDGLGGGAPHSFPFLPGSHTLCFTSGAQGFLKGWTPRGRGSIHPPDAPPPERCSQGFCRFTAAGRFLAISGLLFGDPKVDPQNVSPPSPSGLGVPPPPSVVKDKRWWGSGVGGPEGVGLRAGCVRWASAWRRRWTARSGCSATWTMPWSAKVR